MGEKHYKLGNYEFDTLREYRQAQEDLKKIKYITDELDIYDPEVALRLYNLMRSKKIKFKSEVGKSFFWCISDIVADNSKHVIGRQGGRTEEAMEPLMETNWQKVLGIACIAIAVICFAYYAVSEWQDYRSAKKLENLQQMTDVNNMIYFNAEDTETEIPFVRPEIASDDEIEPPPILEEYAAKHKENPEMIGWLKIEGTQIDYPVMQSEMDQYDYYLQHAFDKTEDSNGTLFVDARNNIINRDTNIIIYGHNMKSGMMFGSLKKYQDKDFLKEHSTIQFDTIYEKGTYQIIGVCLAKVKYQDEDGFRYYNFLRAKNETEFTDYLVNIQQLEVFEQALDASFGDQLLTLSTCNNYIEDGRMFIVAKKI